MRSSHFLIIGAALLAAGLVLAGFSAFAIGKESVEVIEPTSLEPGLSHIKVLKDLPAGRQLILTLSSDSEDVALQAKLTAPDGVTLAIYNITEMSFTSAAASRVPGDHTLEIKNVGTNAVTISGAIVKSPLGQQGGGVNIEDDPALRPVLAYAGVLILGIFLIIAGIVLLIIGAIKHFRDKKSPESVSR